MSGYRTPAQLARLATFLDAVSEGATIAEAGRVVGMSRQQASKLFARVRRDLGEQAA